VTTQPTPRDDEPDPVRRRAAQLDAMSRAAQLLDVDLLLADAWR
jgi:hypothetical protein